VCVHAAGSALGLSISFPSVPGTGKFFLNDVECSGTESNLFQCASGNRFGVNNCGISENAGVTCSCRSDGLTHGTGLVLLESSLGCMYV